MKRSAGEKLWSVMVHLILITCMLVCIFPLWNVVMTSLVDVGEFNSRAIILWPKNFTLASYEYLLFHDSEIANAMGVTALLTAVGTLYSLSITTLVAYARAPLPELKDSTSFVYTEPTRREPHAQQQTQRPTTTPV